MIRQRLTKLERTARPRSQRKVHLVCGMTELEAERKAKELQGSVAWTSGDGLVISSIELDRSLGQPSN